MLGASSPSSLKPDFQTLILSNFALPAPPEEMAQEFRSELRPMSGGARLAHDAQMER